MLLRSIATIIAVGVTCVLFPRSDADARGGGGGFHGGGMAAGFHSGGGSFGLHRGHPVTHGDTRGELHRTRMHQAERDYRRGRDGSNRFTGADLGHWHRSFGFGSNARRAPVADGQWHAGGEFR